MDNLGINVGYRILKYYLWQQFIFRHQVRREKEKLSYHKLSRGLKQFEEEKPTLQKNISSTAPLRFSTLRPLVFFPEVGDEIISIGAVKVKEGEVQRDDTFYQVIDPLQTVSRETKRFTGLRRKDFLNGVTLPIGLERFLEFSKGTILVAHPASFDINFLQKRINKWELPFFDPEFVDSFSLANSLLGRDDCYLDVLIKKFDIQDRTRHHALNDAIMTAEIFERLLKLCYQQEVHTIRGLHEFLLQESG